ncbi:MAG: AarF/ABC1/UbiB kinase family protein [Eubacteriales bacterium]|nr:AarF/ABC1/UbiB kinase family protein [Eubacteriales bacterium]
MQEPKESNRGRLHEITGVLRKHSITKGMTPEKLRQILEDLGPTYIKLGQIMSTRSDILPQKYCEELMKLRSEVPPMDFSEVEEVMESSLGFSWKKEFSSIQQTPLGSASIAQVHRAVLKSGEEVVVKVQRKDIYDTMAKDISLLRRAVRLLSPVSIKGLVDLEMVLAELWTVTQEEMNFLMEATNMERFAHNNEDLVYIETPRLYREFTTTRVLVMEYVDGIAIDNCELLLHHGYDLKEIGQKFADNFIKQIIEDGFFHADPHPGNVMIRDGKIVWMDMGMMGHLSERDRDYLGEAVEGVALNDIGKIQDAVLALGECRGKTDPSKLYEDIRDLMSKYGTADFGSIDIAKLMQDLMEIMKENQITMPHGLTLLARGMTHVEGVLSHLSPEINMVDIASDRLKAQLWQNGTIKKELKNTGKSLFRSLRRAVDLPSLFSDILQGHMKGQTKINLDLHVSSELARLLRRLVRNIVMGLWVMALLISSSIICTTNMEPKILGIPAIGAFGYLFAFIIVLYVFLKHFFSSK